MNRKGVPEYLYRVPIRTLDTGFFGEDETLVNETETKDGQSSVDAAPDVQNFRNDAPTACILEAVATASAAFIRKCGAPWLWAAELRWLRQTRRSIACPDRSGS